MLNLICSYVVSYTAIEHVVKGNKVYQTNTRQRDQSILYIPLTTSKELSNVRGNSHNQEEIVAEGYSNPLRQLVDQQDLSACPVIPCQLSAPIHHTRQTNSLSSLEALCLTDCITCNPPSHEEIASVFSILSHSLLLFMFTQQELETLSHSLLLFMFTQQELETLSHNLLLFTTRTRNISPQAVVYVYTTRTQNISPQSVVYVYTTRTRNIQ